MVTITPIWLVGLWLAKQEKWYFISHVARVCILITHPFSLLFSAPPHNLYFLPLIYHHPSLLFYPSLFFLSFLSSPPLLLLSLSVMYQEGFYGAADLYVSIPLSSALSFSPFPSLLPSVCVCVWTKSTELCICGWCSKLYNLTHIFNFFYSFNYFN